MKRLLFTVFTIFIVNISFSQQRMWVSFYKVDENHRVEYETLMKDVFGKIMKQRVEDGCMKNWIFRRVSNNSSMSEQFTHMTIDVYNDGATNYLCNDEGNLDSFDDLVMKVNQDTEVIRKKVFPNQSKEVFQILNSLKNSARNIIYRTNLVQVSGFNKIGKTPKYAIWCFTKTKNQNYEKRHSDKDWLNAAKKSMGHDAWYSFKRDEPVTGTKEWNYITIDAFDNENEIYKGGSPMSSKTRDMILKKYGTGSSQREIWKRVKTELIFSAKDN
tara:strand:- start:73 stop:888 length:816 start_codon:yes stop_codon:yes gene_type:complete